MKTRFLLLLLILGCATKLRAQSHERAYGPTGQIYRLTDSEAAALYAGKAPAPFREAWLHSLVDTFHNPGPRRPLPAGHYLYRYAIEENIWTELVSRNTLQVWLQPHHRDLCLLVADSTGQMLRDARVLLAGRQVPYDPVLQCYRLHRRIKTGLLEVYAQNEAWFGNVDDEMKKPLWQRGLGYHAANIKAKAPKLPMWSREAFRWVKSWLSPRYRWYRQAGRRKNFSGYIAFSKPKYQPGDTLRVKAYLTDDKGRPWRRPLALSIDEGRGRRVLEQTIHPLTPGAFVFECALSDTLRLDMAYWVSFLSKIKRKHQIQRNLSQSFYFEDYQLDEITYTLSPKQETFRRGEPAVLRLTAKDANDQPVPDASLRLVLTTGRTLGFYAPEVRVPDTLWRHEQAFSPNAETAVVIPDSIWPPADLEVQVEAWCTNSAGELHQEKTGFRIYRNPAPLKTRLERGWLIAERTNAPAGPDSAVLKEIYLNRTVERRVALPWRQALSADVGRYVLQSGDQTAEVELPPAQTAVTHLAVRRPDTVALGLANPHRLAVRYQVFENKRLLDEGVTADSVWTWIKPTGPGPSYRLAYQFLWRGETQKFSGIAPYYNQLLHIDIDQPAEVLPGATAQVKIRVQDARQRPLRGVNLTAGAYNRQFGDDPPYRAPDISYQPPRWAFVRHNFSLTPAKKQVLPTPVTRHWYERLGLDSILFYRLRYRGDGLYSESVPVTAPVLPPDSTPAHPGPSWDLPKETDSFYLYRPQFAPHLIRGNQAQPVYLIYCNSRLVYYYGATGRQRYSFYGWQGYNQIKIRTRGGEYTLDSVYLEAGKKLEIALDGDRYRQVRPPVKVRFEPRPDTLTGFEQDLLRKTMLQWRTEFPHTVHYFWSGADDVQVVAPPGNSTVHLLGPFLPGVTLHHLHQGNTYSSFTFEPGFEYKISPGRERLYESPWPLGQTRLPKALPLKAPGELAWGPHHIVPALRAAPVFYTVSSGRDQPGKASLQLRLPAPDSFRAVVLMGDTLLGPFNPKERFENLPPGEYRLLVYRTDGLYYQRVIQIRRDTLLFLDLRAATFQEPAARERLDSLHLPALKSLSRQVTPTTSQFSQWPGISFHDSYVQGVLTDETGEPLIGATVAAYQGGILVGGTITDFDGQYRLALPPGNYDIQFNYTGYQTKQTSGIRVVRSGITRMEEQMVAATELMEVMITAYKIPLIEQDNTSAGKTISSEQIANLPTRSVHAIMATTAGVDIKGSRNYASNFYIDGIRIDDGLYAVGHESVTGDADEPPYLGLRSQFNDNAYWQPNLITDDNGEAVFQVTFPDNITSWNTFALGMDRRRRAGVATKSTRAFKPLLARLALPRFAVAGDRFDAAGLSTNLGGDSLDIRTVFRLDDRLLRENRARIAEGLSEFVSVQAPADGADSLVLSYETHSAASSDGEKRAIAIQPVGTLETGGHFLVLERDTAFTLEFDPALGPVTVQAQNNGLDLLFDDLEYLRHYPYGCNEQTAGRLTGLLLEKQLAAAGYAPAVGGDPEKAAAQRETEINACLQRLRQGQWADGSWGWWPAAAPNTWMTIYVMRALQTAKAAGYASAAWDKGLIWLRQQVSALPVAEQRDALIFLRSAEVQFDCSPFLNRLDTLPREGLQARLAHWRLQQLCGRPLPIDSLRPLLNPTTLGGLYCGPESMHWYDRRAINTLLAYDLATEAGWDTITRGIRRYWIESRQSAQARNTVETAQIVHRLLPALLATGDSFRSNRLEINGTQDDGFPLKRSFPPGVTSVAVRKTGATELYVNAYQQWHNPTPIPRSDIFAVQSHLEQAGRRVDTLRRGEAAELVVQVHVQQAAEYVLVEIPIPAACSYGEKKQPRLPEVHREYFRDRVAAFCENLPVGRYEFRVPLETRFSGQFTLNPVRVEQMYFQVFYGRNGVREVLVIGRH